MPYPIIAPSDTWFTRGNGNTLRSAITEIEFVDSYTPTGNENKSWDASASLDGSIMVYLTGTKLTIAGNGSGGIYANPDSSYFLADSNAAEWFTSLTKITNLALLNTSKATNMARMFFGVVKLTTIDVGHFDTSNVTDIHLMFGSNSNKVGSSMSLISLDVSNWDLSNVEDIGAMFQQCAKLTNIDVSNWNLSNCKDVGYLFNGCSSLTILNTSNWNLSNVGDAKAMFQNCQKLTSLDVTNWGMDRCTDMSYMFVNCTSLKSLDLSGWDVSKVTSFQSMFAASGGSTGYESNGSLETIDVSNWDVSSCTTMRSMFSGCGKLKTVAVHTWTGTSTCKDMGWMFWGCRGMKSLDLSTWDTSNVEIFHHFLCHNYCKKVVGLENLNLSSCTTMRGMLDESYYEGVLDVSKWDTSNVVDFSFCFSLMPFVTEFKGLNNFNTSKGKCFYRMFQYIPKVTYLDLSSFDTRNATDSYVDPLSGSDDTGMGMFIADAKMLQKVIVGENVSFNGNGIDCETTVLPTPDREYIPDTRGLWYNEETLEQYKPADIPNRTAATYICTPVDVLVKNTTLSDVVDIARRMANTTDKMTPSDAISTMNNALDNNELFDAGMQAEYNRFWDAYQQNGNRTDYSLAFAGRGWNSETLKPKHPITVSNGFEMFRNCGEIDLTTVGVDFDFSQNTSFSNFAYQSQVTQFGVIDTTSATGLSYTFFQCSKLINIAKLILKTDGSQAINSTSFNYCTALENIIIEGVIGANIDLHWSPLTVESMKSVIFALKNFTGTGSEHSYTVSFSDACWAALEADSTAPDGGTWEDYVINTLSWNT